MRPVAIRWALVVGLLGATALQPGRVEAAGPWRAQVVDAETGAPGEWPVVAVWERRRRGDMELGLGREGVVAVADAETDAAGRVVLPARLFVQPPLFYAIRGPELHLVKAGYGGWRFRGAEAALAREGGVIEMRPLPTRAARIAYLEGRTLSTQVNSTAYGLSRGMIPGTPRGPQYARQPV